MQSGVQRQWDDRAEQPGNRERKDCAERCADNASDQGHQQDLRQVDREDAAAAGAESLHCRDGVTPSVEMTFDRIANADTADQQCRQSDDRKKLREALDVAFKLR